MLEPIPFAGYMEIDEMNNKPVAWIVNDKSYQDIFEAEHYSKFANKPMIPLYTHPADITDEEIEEVTNTIEWRGNDWLWELDFARAILRKAQEK